MSKVRVYEVAKQLNLDPKSVVALFQAIGATDVRNHMSSVEPEAVERVKRHLEKQQTHDVVEERIRPGVMKRRAVAKPGAPTGPLSAPALPVAAPSGPTIREVARSVPSVASTDGNGASQAAAPVPAPSAPKERESRAVIRRAKEPVEEKKSVREVSAPKERVSRKSVTALSQPEVAPPPPSARSAQKLELPKAPASKASERLSARASRTAAAAAELAAQVAAVAAVAQAGEEPQVSRSEPPPVVEVHTEPVTPPAAPEPPAPSARQLAELTSAATERAPLVPMPEVAKVALEPPPSPAPPVKAPTPAPPPQTVTQRPSQAPKTGVEYWAGRPGVPMPPPAMTPRLGPSPNTSGTTPRRVQYDPRAATQGPQRRDVRPGGPQPRTGMGSRGMGGGPRRQGGMSGGGSSASRSKIVSTQEMSAHKKVIRIEENITLQGMAGKMSIKSTELLVKLLSMGMTGVHINSTLDADTAKILASDFGWEVEDVAKSEEESIAAARGEEYQKDTKQEPDENLLLRAPVVTVMGHVDHGKTSLLDKIRKSNVAAGEAGGITQHIGAYKVATSQGTIVFLDTPGHEAFTQMRARGASVTDLVVLVVAADDGVMPQTREAVQHAKLANVPILVAVNKIDKPGAEPERVRRELGELALTPEEWGGETIFVNVSALTGEGVDQLLEMIHLQSEVLELKANPKKAASGTVLEALLDRGRGPVARVLVQDGTLKVGDFVLAGAGFGKVRAMTNEHGKQVHEAGPATPVEILGLSEVPGAGDPLDVVKDPKKAQEIAESRKGKISKSLIPATAKVSLEELSKRISDTGQQELRVVIKGDVQGSVEAVADALAKLSTEKARLSILHAAVGAITEGDVNLAIAAKAIVLGFNVRPAGKAASLADENKIEIRSYSIIYNAVDDVRGAMEGLLPPILVERALGKAEVRKIFKLKVGSIAGCFVTQGLIKRVAKARLLRAGQVIYEGKVASLKRIKDDVKDVAEGFECGICLDGAPELQELDIIDAYEIEEVKQKL